MERWEAKLISLFIVFILPFLCTLAPYWVSPWILRKGQKGERFLCYLMCFGGGIFFATFLLHMAPEVREILDTTLLDPNEIVYPVTDLIIGCGFFFVLYLEKIVMRVNKRRMQRKERELQRCCIMYHEESVTAGKICHNCREGLKCAGYVNEGQTKDHSGDHDLVFNSRIAFHVKEIEDSSAPAVSCHPQETKTTTGYPEYAVANGTAAGAEKEKTAEMRSGDQSDASSVSSHDDDGHHGVRSLILIVALSLHHIFEGLALGLSNSVQDVFALVIALMCHETIISFSLGLQFVKSRYSLKRMLVTTFCVSAIMPIGVAVGMVMSEVGAPSNELDMASGIVQAFACGTFIFVTFFEILQEEIDPHDTSIGKVTGAAMGFAVIALLMLIPEGSSEEEGHAAETTTAFFQNVTSASVLF